MTLGENLKSYREQVGLSQEELGEKLSVSAETIADWETGARVPEVADLLRLKDVCGVSVDLLLKTGTTLPDAGPFPQEVYREQFTPEEWKKIIKATQWRGMRKSLVLLAILVLLLCYALFYSLSVATSGAIVGIIFVFAAVNLRYVIAAKKNYDNTKEKIAACTYEYRVFADYLEIYIYRNGEQIRQSKLSFENIERFFDVGDYILFQNAGQAFTLRKSDLKADSFFLTYPQMHPEKAPYSDANQKQKIVSNTLIFLPLACLLLAPALLGKLGFDYSWILYIGAAVSIASFCYGVSAKKKGYKKYRLNLAVGIVCGILLLVFGSYCFIFRNLY